MRIANFQDATHFFGRSGLNDQVGHKKIILRFVVAIIPFPLLVRNHKRVANQCPELGDYFLANGMGCQRLTRFNVSHETCTFVY
jgi:hypothetical protein